MASVNKDPSSRLPKILLVDDREDNLLSIEAILEPDGYQFFKAYSGDQALKILLNEFDFAMILMDVKMPVLNGFETATLIHEREKLRHVPIIFITANNYGDENVFKGYQAGGIDYIFKPINPEVLRAKVAVFIDLYKKDALLFEQEQKLSIINMNLENEINSLKASQEKMRQHNSKLRKEISSLESVLATSKLSIDRSELVETDLNALLNGLLADMDDLLMEKMATVSIEPLPSLPASAALLRPLFQNLIHNALEHSRANIRPVIQIRSEIGSPEKNHNLKGQNNKKHCKIFVEENGVRFDQTTDGKISDSATGSNNNGLNGANQRLDFCRKIAEQHDGFLAVNGKIGDGASFILSLPMSR